MSQVESMPGAIEAAKKKAPKLADDGGIPSRPGKRALGKADKLSRIMAAARELFFNLGYEDTTTQAVAQLAGIGAGTLFSYARTKEDLLTMVFMGDLIEVALKSRRNAQRKIDLMDKIHSFFLGMLEYHYLNTILSRHLIRELVFVKDQRRDTERARLLSLIRGSIESFFMDAAAQGNFATGIDYSLLSINCFSIYYMTLQRGLAAGWSLKACADELRARLALQVEPLRHAGPAFAARRPSTDSPSE